jgi:hypothetical protein
MPQIQRRYVSPAEDAAFNRLLEQTEAQREKEQELREAAKGKFLEADLGWDKPGREGVDAMVESLKIVTGHRQQMDVFSQLKQAAGGASFTYLGRVVEPNETFDDVLKRVPIGELETGAAVGKALALDPWKRVVPTAPPQLPGRGGAQQLGIYKFASLLNYVRERGLKQTLTELEAAEY